MEDETNDEDWAPEEVPVLEDGNFNAEMRFRPHRDPQEDLLPDFEVELDFQSLTLEAPTSQEDLILYAANRAWRLLVWQELVRRVGVQEVE